MPRRTGDDGVLGPFGGGGRGQANPQRPFLTDRTVGGQRPNVQKDQGKDGYQTGGIYVSKDDGESWSAHQQPQPAADVLLPHPRRPDRRQAHLRPRRYHALEEHRRRQDVRPANARGVHPDHHALWIDPQGRPAHAHRLRRRLLRHLRPRHDWDHLNTLALGQFYHVAVDNRKPYRVYGGLQDNGSGAGRAHAPTAPGRSTRTGCTLSGGDGFVCRVDPSDPDIVYSESQGGGIIRRNLRTGESRCIRPQAVKQGEALRWNWNTPFILSHHNPSIFYSAAQYVFRSVNRGDDLKAISPEIYRDQAGDGTAMAESPRNADVLWVGTDDGNVWVTRDGGRSGPT